MNTWKDDEYEAAQDELRDEWMARNSRECVGCGATGRHADLSGCNACDNHVCEECQTRLQKSLGVCSDECAAEEATWLIKRVEHLRKELRSMGRTA